MNVRAKFTVTKVAEMGYQGANGPHVSKCYQGGQETDVPMREITMTAVYDNGLSAENRSFAEATPSGSMTFLLSNAALKDEFRVGSTYYLDFTPAE
jgi:hypothetical protein